MKRLHILLVLLVIACLPACNKKYIGTTAGASAIPTSGRSSGPVLIQYEGPSSIRQIPLTPEIEIPALVPGYTLYVPSGRPRGVVVLFANGRESSQSTERRQFNRAAAQRQLATLFVTTANPLEFLFDSVAYLQLDQFIGQAIMDHDLPKDKLLFTGRSLGGTRALKFAEWCAAGHSAYQLQPRALVLYDCPLDFFRHYKEGQCNPSQEEEQVSTVNWLQYQLHTNLGGSPIEVPHAYRNYSPYLFELSIHEPLYPLADVAVRAYIPRRKRRSNSVLHVRQDQNNEDAVGLINDLQYLGNEDVELIVSDEFQGEGIRDCYPEPWPIVDQEGMLDWFASVVAPVARSAQEQD